MVAVVPYSSEVQQPMRATAVLDGRPHMRWAAQRDREQGRAGSLQPDSRSRAAGDVRWHPRPVLRPLRCGPRARDYLSDPRIA